MIEQKQTALGIELGSTRIKAVLVSPDGSVLASGAHDWETILRTATGPIPSQKSGTASGMPTATWPGTTKRPTASR